MSLAILFHFLCTQHVSDTSSGACDYSVELPHWSYCSACNTDTTPTQPHRNPNTHRTKNNTTNVVIQQNSRKLLMTDILMSETCWAHKKWNKIASDIKLVFYSSNITMMHCAINLRFTIWIPRYKLLLMYSVLCPHISFSPAVRVYYALCRINARNTHEDHNWIFWSVATHFTDILNLCPLRLWTKFHISVSLVLCSGDLKLIQKNEHYFEP